LFWTACRKWAERAVSLRLLSVADLNADPAACEVAEPSPPVSAERLEEAAELLDDLLLGLFDLPGDAWSDLAVALPDELYDRIDQYIESLQES
jgi:hypothetical protein